MEGYQYYNRASPWQRTSWMAWQWNGPPSSLNRPRWTDWAWTMGHLETCCKHWGTWDLDRTFHGTSRSDSNYFFHYNQSYFIQAYVPLPFVVAIGNLQLNKTLHSVTCINCKLCTCLNSSISLKNDSLLILRSWHNLWLPINLQWPWEEGPKARLASQLFTKLL